LPGKEKKKPWALNSKAERYLRINAEWLIIDDIPLGG
jgi:hypothetical protein